MDDEVNALHRPGQPIDVANIPHEEAQPGVVAELFAHVCLGMLSAREDADALRHVAGEQMGGESPAEPPAASRYQDALNFPHRAPPESAKPEIWVDPWPAKVYSQQRLFH